MALLSHSASTGQMPGNEDGAPAVPVRAGYRISRVDTIPNPPTSSAGGSSANSTTNPAMSRQNLRTLVGRGQKDQTQQDRPTNSGAHYKQQNRGGGGGGGRHRRNGRGGGKTGNRGRHNSRDGERAVTTTPRVPAAAAQDHLRQERTGAREACTGGRNSSTSAQQQARPETSTLSPIRPSSVGNVATVGEANRAQAQRENPRNRPDRDNPGGRGREVVTHQRAASPRADLWDNSRSTQARKDSATTAGIRRDVHSRLGSRPPSPRNSLFRDDSRSAHKAHNNHRRKQQHQEERHHSDYLQPTACAQSGARSTAGQAKSPREGRVVRERKQESSTATSSGRGGRNNTALVPGAAVAQDSDGLRRSAVSSHEKVAPRFDDFSGRHSTTSTKCLSAAAGGAGAVYARGTCMTMCPKSEMLERQAEATLSMFEATEDTASLHFRHRKADPARTVKKYRRSAAGRDMRR